MAKSDKDPRKKLPPRERRRNSVGRDPRAEARAARAESRAEKRAARSAEEQLSLLDERPGDTKRERRRLS